MNLPPPPHVLWVEDDPAVRRLVSLVLEDESVQLTLCASVAEALAALQARPADLIVTDLMLPDEPGMALLARLAAQPALRGTARLAVCSAGLNPALRSQLTALGVWRALSKPASVSELAACVSEGLAPLLHAQAPAAQGEASAGAPQPDVVASFFGGDALLFQAYRDSCQAQFAHDLRLGEQALAEADWPALGRLAHSLKTVLASLGHTAAGEQAAELERLCAASATGAPAGPALLPAWALLREALQALSGPCPPP